MLFRSISYKAPHVFSTQDQFPHTNVDAKVSSRVYPRNSPNKGSALLRSASIGRGAASRETGVDILKSRTGAKSSTDGRERWMRMAKLKSDADARPGTRRQG